MSLNTSVNQDHPEHRRPLGLYTHSWDLHLFEYILNYIMQFIDGTKVGSQQQEQEVSIQRVGGAACRLVERQQSVY